jgi:predicted nucleic acid-binding protein
MRDKVFIDSNIFLYAFSDKNLDKQKIAAQIIKQEYTISVQVINEVNNNMLKKLNFSDVEIKKFILGCYERYNVVNYSKDIFINASELRQKYNISYWDSLIISSALENGCTILYSEDMQHNQIIENQLKIVNPFM